MQGQGGGDWGKGGGGAWAVCGASPPDVEACSKKCLKAPLKFASYGASLPEDRWVVRALGPRCCRSTCGTAYACAYGHEHAHEREHGYSYEYESGYEFEYDYDSFFMHRLLRCRLRCRCCCHFAPIDVSRHPTVDRGSAFSGIARLLAPHTERHARQTKTVEPAWVRMVRIAHEVLGPEGQVIRSD